MNAMEKNSKMMSLNGINKTKEYPKKCERYWESFSADYIKFLNNYEMFSSLNSRKF